MAASEEGTGCFPPRGRSHSDPSVLTEPAAAAVGEPAGNGPAPPAPLRAPASPGERRGEAAGGQRGVAGPWGGGSGVTMEMGEAEADRGAFCPPKVIFASRGAV